VKSLLLKTIFCRPGEHECWAPRSQNCLWWHLIFSA